MRVDLWLVKPGLQVVEFVRVRLVGKNGRLIIVSEGFLDYFSGVLEVQDKGVRLLGVGPVQSGQVWTALMPERVLSTYIVCSRGSS